MALAPDEIDSDALPPGFEPIRRLGGGGMGVVILARQASLNRRVAVKLLPRLSRGEAASRAERFRREAELMARISHPNIVAIHDFGVADGRPYLVMEYVEGGDLARQLGPGRRIEPGRARELIGPIARAMTALHRAGLLHLDLKPSNILMQDEATPRVADFGLATPGGLPGPAAGTPGYMAPEQKYGLKVDERTDQYALAAVAYELLTGRRPLGAFAPPSRDRRGLAPGVDEALRRALSEERDDRFATVDEFAAALDRGLAASRRGRRRPAVATLLAAAVLGGLALSSRQRPASSTAPEPGPVVSPPAIDPPPTVVPMPDVVQATPAPAPPERFVNSLGMTMVLIQPGTFAMGSPPGDPDALNDEPPEHRARLTRPYYLASCEVTNGQFLAFVDRTGYRTEAERTGKGGFLYDPAKGAIVQDPKWTFRAPRPGPPPGGDLPVVQVTWADAVAFCDWMAKQEGHGYRLPTEAEWEYACRAGTTTRWSTGDDPATVDGAAWTQKNADSTLHPVGKKAPNPWGLHDMHGNAWEWCSDWFGPYSDAEATDPLGLRRGDKRALRGGSWDYGSVARTRSASRIPDPPDRAHFTHGFRVAIGPRGEP